MAITTTGVVSLLRCAECAQREDFERLVTPTETRRHGGGKQYFAGAFRGPRK